jgi:hypothetical protein
MMTLSTATLNIAIQHTLNVTMSSITTLSIKVKKRSAECRNLPHYAQHGRFKVFRYTASKGPYSQHFIFFVI